MEPRPPESPPPAELLAAAAAARLVTRFSGAGTLESQEASQSGGSQQRGKPWERKHWSHSRAQSW
eukprot:6409676-Alexandrium_andersonii.AAC.1